MPAKSCISFQSITIATPLAEQLNIRVEPPLSKWPENQEKYTGTKTKCFIRFNNMLDSDNRDLQLDYQQVGLQC